MHTELPAPHKTRFRCGPRGSVQAEADYTKGMLPLFTAPRVPYRQNRNLEKFLRLAGQISLQQRLVDLLNEELTGSDNTSA